jgi:phosphohistidine phosphatase
MKRLILFRHGKTERHAPGGEDFDRRLTVRGVEDSHRMGRVLAEAGFAPDLTLVSTAVRAQGTWEAAKAAFPDAAVQSRPELYNADTRDLFRLARAAPADGVMIVAHNPGLQDLATALVEQAGESFFANKLRDGFPTAAVAVFDFDGEAVTARGLFFPRDHGGGGDND